MGACWRRSFRSAGRTALLLCERPVCSWNVRRSFSFCGKLVPDSRLFPDSPIISSIDRSTADNCKNREQPGTGNSLGRGSSSNSRLDSLVAEIRWNYPEMSEERIHRELIVFGA